MSKESDEALERMKKRDALRFTPAGKVIEAEFKAAKDAASAKFTSDTAQEYATWRAVFSKYHPLINEASDKWDKYSKPFVRQMDKEVMEAEEKYRNAMGKLMEAQDE